MSGGYHTTQPPSIYIHPASAVWGFDFSLDGHLGISLVDTTGFSRVEFQFLPIDFNVNRPKLKLHATKVGGVKEARVMPLSKKLKLHTAEAGGVRVLTQSLPPWY